MLGIPIEVWLIIGVVSIVALLIVAFGWFTAYCLFDWGVSHVKESWRDDK